MTQPNPPNDSASAGKGAAFFKRAEQVAEMSSWDFAIEMYLQGIKREPDNVARGHQGLREVSLKRKSQGGKSAGMVEQLKYRGGKGPVEKLANAEYLLAKEPGSVGHMIAVMKAAVEADLPLVVKWICDIVLEAERQAKKPNKGVLVQIIQAYEGAREFAQAIHACQLALQANPDDDALQTKLRDLSANNTMKQGKYDQEAGDFTKSVKDMGKQKELARSEYIQQTRQAMEERIEAARKEYVAAPTAQGKVHGLVDALLKIEEETYENEAIDVLNKAFRDTSAYQYKMRVGDIRMRQENRRYRKLAEAGDKTGAAAQLKHILAFEMQEFSERAANYPTDLAIKFELARRQLLSGMLDEAIASFQQAQRDPRRHVRSLTYLGQAFAAKKWYREASETYEKALQAEMTEDRAKEIRHSFGDVLEKMGDAAPLPPDKLASWQKALDQFSQVAQIDYNYRDTAARIESLRKKMDAARAAGAAPATG